MCKYFVASFALILVICGGSSAGDPPGILSLKRDPPGVLSVKKCYEYRGVMEAVPSYYYQALTEEDIKFIQEKESYNGPGNAFAGGVDAKPKELPFMAALGYEVGTQKKYFCGGSLVSELFVLTAAHCINTREWGEVKFVRLGDLNLANASDDASAQEVRVQKHYVHPNYSPPERYHDIALVKLRTPVTFTDYVQPVCLQARRDGLRHTTFYAAGWGVLGYGEDPSDRLQVGILKHYSIEACQRTFPNDKSIPRGIADALQVCAGAKTHIADTCEGDSGGPLAYMSNYPETFVLVGITSFGKACALGRIPAVYTRVSNYVAWIEKIVWPETLAKDMITRMIFNDRIVFPDE